MAPVGSSETLPGGPLVADVLLLLPLAQTYTYSIPPSLAGRVRRGAQVDCPVRNRPVSGLVIAVRPPRDDDPPRLSPLTEVVANRAAWPSDLMDLVDWAARYYVAPSGVVARTAMPSLFARRAPKSEATVRFVQHPDVPPRSPRDKAILAALEAAGEMDMAAARALVPDGITSLRRLLAKGCLRMDTRAPDVADAPLRPTHVERPVPTSGQADALLKILAAVRGDKYAGYLLHGVTGSGKTEVYLCAIEAALERGRGAIVLVPEIALTIDLRRRFEKRFGGIAAVLHSAMPETRRAKAWDDVLSGRIRVVVGPRSAVWAPMPNLGLIVVDEEHETSYKQQEGLRYNARDLALVRGTLAKCPVILGSATPSLETFQNAHDRKLTYLSLPSRVLDRTMPPVTLVDLRYQPVIGGERLFSQPLRDALATTLERGESAILFLNRRGFGRFILCRTCGTAVRCPNCSITMTHHARPERLCCHYCDHATPVPGTCPTCNSTDVEVLGFGTERVEDEVARLVPNARVGRLDSDTSPGGGLDRILGDFRTGKLNVLVGTQIVAKGHDFPRVTLVGVLLAEQSLAFPDFRAPERTFQLLTQVAGRAGRGDTPGVVIVQTYDPTQYALQYASTHDYLGFAVAENRMRRERGYPPHSHLAAIEISSPDAREAGKVADDVREAVSQFLMALGPAGRKVIVLGPSAAAIERLRGRTRQQMLLKGNSRATLNDVLWRVQRMFGNGHGDTRIVLDVDPVSLL
jgi:primosomal protein N' (replication factor Y)